MIVISRITITCENFVIITICGINDLYISSSIYVELGKKQHHSNSSFEITITYDVQFQTLVSR